MNGGNQPLGYTLVEVLIVLAVSSMLFVLAANFVSGKQAKTAFAAGIEETATKIQEVIDQVTNGRYSDRRFECSINGAALKFTLKTGANIQGTNEDCVFIGKYFHFNGGGSDKSKYEIFSLAGLRLASGQPPDNLDDADVSPIHESASFGNVPLTTYADLPQQLEFGGAIVAVGGVNIKYFGFGFAQGLGKENEGDDTGHTFESGYQAPNLIYSSAHIAPAIPDDGAASAIGGGGNLLSADKVIVCLTDETRYATVTVGDNGNALSVRVQRQADKTAWEALGCGLAP